MLGHTCHAVTPAPKDGDPELWVPSLLPRVAGPTVSCVMLSSVQRIALNVIKCKTPKSDRHPYAH